MTHTVSTLPFHMADLYQGLVKCHGLLHCDGEALHIELQLRDALTGWLRGKIRQYEIPLQQLAGVEYDVRFFGLLATCNVQVSSMSLLIGFPHAKSGRCRLGIARKDRQKAKAFVEYIKTLRA